MNAKEIVKMYGAVAIAASVCVFLLHYIIPLLFVLLEWTFTQPLYVRAGVVSMIVAAAVFLVCVMMQGINNEYDESIHTIVYRNGCDALPSVVVQRASTDQRYYYCRERD